MVIWYLFIGHRDYFSSPGECSDIHEMYLNVVFVHTKIVLFLYCSFRFELGAGWTIPNQLNLYSSKAVWLIFLLLQPFTNFRELS